MDKETIRGVIYKLEQDTEEAKRQSEIQESRYLKEKAKLESAEVEVIKIRKVCWPILEKKLH